MQQKKTFKKTKIKLTASE